MPKAELIRPDEEIYDVTFPDEKPEELTAAEKAAQAAVEQLSSNAEQGSRIRIYRQHGTGKESMEFVCQYPADKYTIDDLIEMMQREYGGGDYRFMIYNEKGRLSANKLISIAKKARPERSDNGDMFTAITHMLDKQDEFMRRMFAHQNESGTSRLDFMREMMMMKEIFGSNQSNGLSQVKELFEMQKMVKEMSEPEEKDSGFSSIIKESIPLLTAMAGAAKSNPVRRSNPNARRQRKTTNGDNTQMKAAVDHLIQLAEQKQPTDAVAEKLLEEIPDIAIPQIENLILSPNPVSIIAGINNKAESHKEWLLDLCEWLKGYLGHPSKYDAEFNEDLTEAPESADNSSHGKDDNAVNGNPVG